MPTEKSIVIECNVFENFKESKTICSFRYIIYFIYKLRYYQKGFYFFEKNNFDFGNIKNFKISFG